MDMSHPLVLKMKKLVAEPVNTVLKYSLILVVCLEFEGRRILQGWSLVFWDMQNQMR